MARTSLALKRRKRVARPRALITASRAPPAGRGDRHPLRVVVVAIVLAAPD
jgi:hypothetical protein